MAVGVARNLDLAAAMRSHPERDAEVLCQRLGLVDFAIVSEGAVVHVQPDQLPALLLEHVRRRWGINAPTEHDDCFHAARYHAWLK